MEFVEKEKASPQESKQIPDTCRILLHGGGKVNNRLREYSRGVKYKPSTVSGGVIHSTG